MFIPPRGRSEREAFSLGERPIPGKETGRAPGRDKEPKQLSKSMDENVKALKDIFHVPDSSDIVFREFVSANPRVRTTAAYVEGLASFDKVFRSVLQPLMILGSTRQIPGKDPLKEIKEALLPNGQVEEKKTFGEIVEAMVSGDTVVIVDGSDTVLSVETKGWEHRSVEQAVTERIVRGPQQGFGEVLRVNTALLRATLHSPDLVVENIEIGKTAKTQCALVYMANIANSKVVAEMRRRLSAIDASEVLTSGMLEQFIETSHSLVPTVISTERPDRVAHFILEGAVAVLVAGDPFALLAPVTAFAFIHSPEDYYVRWPYGNILRFLRTAALIIAVLLPGLYVAIINYHPEMVPTVLILAIAASRELVPLPLPFEVLLMYFGFELIREAGIRIPSPIGPTIGIVGALLIGEAAVSASLVSPIMVIVIAVTAVASFTIPNQEAGMLIRVLTLIFILAGSLAGLFGIVATMYVLLCRAFSLQSLGVPFFAPVTPKKPSAQDTVVVGPAWDMELRPSFLRPRQPRRQGNVSRLWDKGNLPETADSRSSQDSGMGPKESSKGKNTGQKEPG